MSEDLDVRTDALEGRTGTTNTDLRIGQYDFFAPESENRYDSAQKNDQARLDDLRSQPFTNSFPRDIDIRSGTDYVQAIPILETPREYTQGLYDEAGMMNTGLTLIAVIIAGGCVATFFITRAWHKFRRRKAEECTSQSQ